MTMLNFLWTRNPVLIMQQPVPDRIALKYVIPLETGCFAVANKIFELHPICHAVLYIE